MNKISQFVYRASLTLLFVFLILMGLSAFGYLEDIHSGLFLTKIIQLLFLSCFILIAFSFLLKKKLSHKYYLGGVLFLSFLLRLIFIIQKNPTQVSDFLYMYNSAMDLAQGNSNALKTSYYNFAIFNTPFTIYEAFLLKWFDSIFLLKLLSVFYSTLIVLFIYKIAQSIFGWKVARIAGFIACIFPPFIIYNAVLTNQTISILFLLMGVYAIINKKYMYGGLLLGLGQVFRPIGIMFLIGAILMIFWEWYTKKESFYKHNLKQLLTSGLRLVVPYYFVLLSVSGFLVSFHYTDHGLFYNPTPSYKFLVGLNQETKGSYSKTDNKLIDQDIEGFEEIAREKINERTVNLTEVASLFEHKFKEMWGSKDASFFWTKLSKNGLILFNQYFWIFILLSSGAVILFIRKKNTSYHLNGSLYLVWTFLGFIFIYLLIEIQTRYRYELYPLFILTSALGSIHILKVSEKQINLRTIKFIFLLGLMLFLFTFIPNSFFQRTIRKEILFSPSTKTIEVDQALNDHVQIQRLVINNLNDSTTSISMILNKNVEPYDINKYAMAVRAGLPDGSGKELKWDFKPVLYNFQDQKYMEKSFRNMPDSVVYLNFRFYDRSGYSGFRGKLVKIENIQLKISQQK